jgi:DNA-binding transcriptional LysR family regulator
MTLKRTIQQLTTFQRVARSPGGINAVARELRLGDSGISGQLAGVEEFFGGAPLLAPISPGQPLTLTDRGRQLLAFIDAILGTFDAARDALVGPPERNLLDLAATRSLCTYVFPDLLSRARNRLPQTHVRITPAESSTLVGELVITRKVELGLVHSALPPPGDELLDRVTVAQDPLVLVHQKARRAPTTMTLQELAKQPLILFGPNTMAYGQTRDIFRQVGVDPTIRLEVESVETAVMCVRRGEGFSLLPQMAVMNEIKAGALCRIRLKNTHDLDRRVDLIYAKSYGLSAAARAFLETVTPRRGITFRVGPQGESRQVRP